MTTSTITVEELIRRHADDLAYVAEAAPAGDLDAFLDQLGTAAGRFDEAGITGHEDLETAAVLLAEARDNTEETSRHTLLHRAGELLTPVWEMTQEYRDMVGG
ncbi:hypothetical protein [Streptomyces sasae]|uniref:hypothetical protein n=1 Tax=Streptomyces sasae TaxID=1266772 RepID=UPI00292DB24A|nr:hypothetical protein [Streptomyces sasae]